MGIEIIYEGNLQTRCKHLQSSAVIYTEPPVDNQGRGEQFSPTDLIASGLACCVLTIAGIYAQRLNVDIKGTRAEVSKIMETNPRRISEIKIDLFFPQNNYSEKEKEIIKTAANDCPVARSLHPDVKQTINFNF